MISIELEEEDVRTVIEALDASSRARQKSAAALQELAAENGAVSDSARKFTAQALGLIRVGGIFEWALEEHDKPPKCPVEECTYTHPHVHPQRDVSWTAERCRLYVHPAAVSGRCLLDAGHEGECA